MKDYQTTKRQRRIAEYQGILLDETIDKMIEALEIPERLLEDLCQ